MSEITSGRAMKNLTQAHLHPGGDCWQTCVAMLLDVDPSTMPSQHAIETTPTESGHQPTYNNALRSYLYHHHGLTYETVPARLFGIVAPLTAAPHMLIGPTVRTPATGILHVVVGVGGVQSWDPHPSRAGLTVVDHWGFLAPFPDEWRAAWDRNPCVCPTCVVSRLAPQ